MNTFVLTLLSLIFMLDGTYCLSGIIGDLDEDCMILTEEQNAVLFGDPSRIARRDVTYRWDQGIIPYEITEDYGQDHRNMIRSAMDEWEKYTCVSFRERTFEDSYVIIRNRPDCSSNVGRLPIQYQPQFLNLSIPNCMNPRIIIHELGHALGRYHEHQRPNRNQYTIFLTENLRNAARIRDFEVENEGAVNDFGVTYDYWSVMHYHSTAYAKSVNHWTLVTTDPIYQTAIGTVPRASMKDILVTNLMYSCTDLCNNPGCPGILDKNCKCLCYSGNPSEPVSEWNGVSACLGPGIPLDAETTCVDSDCDYTNGCRAHPYDVIRSCRKLCSICGGRADRCVDDDICASQANRRDCERFPGMLKMRCRKTCGVCEANIGPCQPNPCRNGATCRQTSGGYICDCTLGYSGANCTIDACMWNPCRNQGSCHRTSGGYTCACRVGYSGIDCTTDVCVPNPCKNQGTCRRLFGYYRCDCPQGYSGGDCAITPCSPACGPYLECLPSISNIDEVVCRECADIRELSHVCRMVEAARDYCRSDENRRQLRRMCPLTCGYCQNPCKPNPCFNNGTCGRQGDGHYCRCSPGFGGYSCLLNFCRPNPCENQGTCQGITGGYICICPNGYEGTNCEMAPVQDVCTPNPCMNQGTCTVNSGIPICVCPPGSTGLTCERGDYGDKFDINRNSHKIGGTRVDAGDENECQRLCFNDVNCGGVDWNLNKRECWQHSASSVCGRPLISNICCTSYQKKSLPCVAAGDFNIESNRHKLGATRFSASGENGCVQLCKNDGNCGSVDWDKDKKECWIHSVSRTCRRSLMTHTCCTNYEKKSLACSTAVNLMKMENTHKEGANEITAAVDESACTQHCMDTRECGGVDWDKKTKRCWMHSPSKECSIPLLRNACCNHYKNPATTNC